MPEFLIMDQFPSRALEEPGCVLCEAETRQVLSHPIHSFWKVQGSWSPLAEWPLGWHLASGIWRE